jgi:hypothetical protein
MDSSQVKLGVAPIKRLSAQLSFLQQPEIQK